MFSITFAALLAFSSASLIPESITPMRGDARTPHNTKTGGSRNMDNLRQVNPLLRPGMPWAECDRILQCLPTVIWSSSAYSDAVYKNLGIMITFDHRSLRVTRI